MFELRDIEILQDVVRAGGFRAAAVKYGLSQSAISARVAALEKRLGILVFDRSKRRIRLTAAGRRFLEEAGRLVAARDRISQTLTHPDGLSGTVRIGVAETIVHTILTDMVKQLKKRYGDVRFEIAVDTSEQLSRALLDDEIDVAILLRESVPQGAIAALLAPVALGWYAASDLPLPHAPLTPADLASCSIVTFPKATPPFRELEQVLSAPDIPSPDLHGSASLSTVIHLVATGFGIGVLPTRMVEGDLMGRALKPIMVVESLNLSPLRFVVAYLPDRNREVGEAVTAIATELDHNDLEKRSLKY